MTGLTRTAVATVATILIAAGSALVPRGADAAAANTDFVITYTDAVDAATRGVVEAAAGIWSAALDVDVPVKVAVDMTNLSPGQLAEGGPTNAYYGHPSFPDDGQLYPSALADQFAGRDLNPSGPDITLTLSSAIAWDRSTDGTAAGQSMLQVAVHEMAHGLGHTSWTQKSSVGYVVSLLLLGKEYVLGFDDQVVTGNGTPLAALSGTALGDALEGPLYWNGPAGIAANGGVRPRLYSPTPFESGSSVGHLDESSFGPHLMTPKLASGEAVTGVPSLTAAMMADLGWRLEPSATPAGPSAAALAVQNGRWVVLTGDFDGDGRDDAFLYEPGTDEGPLLWGADRRGLRVQLGLDVRLTYRPVTGDFDGDGRGDILWYAPGTAADFVWYGRADRTFDVGRVYISGYFWPFAGEFDGDRADEIFWYAPGTATDYITDFIARGHTRSVARTVNGSYRPVVLRYGRNQDEPEKILWYRPGPAPDYVWSFVDTGGAEQLSPYVSQFDHQSRRWVDVSGNYRPVAGDFNGDGADEVFWYGVGTAPDVMWTNEGWGTFTGTKVTVNGTYRLGVGDFDGDGEDDVLFHGPGATGDALWWSGNRYEGGPLPLV